jgi:hypothetical protein
MVFQVNGINWPAPLMEGYQVIENPNVAEGAARDAASADALIDFVAYVGQLVVPYAYLSSSQVQAMYDSLAPHTVPVTFFNINSGQTITQDFYFDKFQSTFAAGNPDGEYWVKDVTITFTGIEGYTR